MVTRYCSFFLKGKSVGTVIVPENSSPIAREIAAREADIPEYDAVQLYSATDDRFATPASESSLREESPTNKRLDVLQRELIDESKPSYLKH
jgi:hypothetical protein